MTSEEAIKQLEDLDNCYNQLSDDDKEALDLAIKALEQESCGDAKSETVTEFADRCRECGARYGKLLKQEQSGEKTGRWIDIMVGDTPAQACDQCNTFYPLAYTGGGHNYCPNCGAKMQEVTE